MNLLLVMLTAATLTVDPPKPQPFSSGTDLTINLGWQDGGFTTPDGALFSVGMLTQRTGRTRWAYEIAFVSNNDHCYNDGGARYCGNDWGVQLFGGINYDFPLTPDKKLFISLRGGVFAALANIDRYYYYDRYDDWDDDNLVLAAGLMGKAGLYFEFNPFRIGGEVMGAIGPSLGTESGLGIYLPISIQFTFHIIF